MFRRLLLPALLVTLSACASDDHSGPLHGSAGGDEPPGGGRPGGPPPVRLFVSPSGEPFRGEGGLGRWFAQVDTDHDGAITIEEFRADALHSFKVLDTNGDGTIDGLELQHYEHEVVPEIGIMAFDMPGAGQRPSRHQPMAGNPRGTMGDGISRSSAADNAAQMLADAANRAPPAAGRDGAARFSLLNEPQPISAADADVDGKVTLKEWMAQTDRRFAKLDHLKNGRLTMDSLLKAQPRDQKSAPKKP